MAAAEAAASGVATPHLLLLPAQAGSEDVVALTLSRYPEAIVEVGEGAVVLVQIGPGLALSGPQRVAESGLPGWAASAYRLTAPTERGGPVPVELRGRGGLLDAFAEGEPIGAERELIELALSVARRLGGAVLVGGGGERLLTPEPRADLLLYTDVWLHPDALVQLLAPALPGLALPGDVPAAPVPAPSTEPSLVEDEGERRWLHAEADAYDAAALAEPEVTEAYGAVATDPDGTVWSVAVEAAAGVPAVLGGLGLAGLLRYELRCYPVGADLPADAVPKIDAAAQTLLTEIGGHVVDDDGFLVALDPA